MIRNVFDDGSLDDDELMAEYLGGVLASSKSHTGRDDRGVALSALINGLSSYTLRMHYIFYSALQLLAKGSDTNWREERNREDLRTYIPWASYTDAMEFETPEEETTATEHALFAIQRQGLIGDFLVMGSAEAIWRQTRRQAPDEGIVFQPSMPGIELYLWAHGYGRRDYGTFLDVNEEFLFEVGFELPEGSSLLKDLPRTSTSAQEGQTDNPVGGPPDNEGR